MNTLSNRMRTSVVLYSFLFLCLIIISNVQAWKDDQDLEGFLLPESSSGIGEALAVSRNLEVSCPSADVIRTLQRCHVKGHWVDCHRDSCCPGYTMTVSRCIPDTEDPCSPEFAICEQRCSLYFGRVVCSCFSGYKFNKTRHALQQFPYCQDKNECLEGNGGCDQVCMNQQGGVKCSCEVGYTLQYDNITCLVSDQAGYRPFGSSGLAITKLQKTVDKLQERFNGLNTAIKLYSFAGGQTGRKGDTGPPGPPGPRGFPGPAGGSGILEAQGDGVMESEMDSYTIVQGVNMKENRYCKCKRGARGPPGVSGNQGPRGPRGEQGVRGQKGDQGSFDFLQAMLADVRHDIEALQEAVFTKENQPRRYGLTYHRTQDRLVRPRPQQLPAHSASTQAPH